MNRFLEALNKQIIFIDGAMGTMLQRSGLNPGENPSLLCITNPKVIEDIHAAYFKAGSHIVYTNTFSASSPKLEGTGHSVDDVISAAVGCARRAAAPFDGMVALDIGPLGELLEPLGTMPFERAVELFTQQIRAGVKAGVDLIAIETMMDVYEAKAALLAAKECCNLPVIVTMTFEAGGRTFTGCDIPAMALTLEGHGADVIGVNCSVGPLQLGEIITELRRWTRLPIAAKPNAGLPNAGGGYDLSDEQFADGMRTLIACGASVVGGCCGTTPEYIFALTQTANVMTPIPAPKTVPCAACSSTVSVLLDAPIVVGERLNPTGKKLLKQALADSDMGYILRQAVAQQEDGAQMLDVNVGLPGIDEPAMMAKVVKAIQSVCPLPLQIDSSNPDAIEAGLRVYNGRAVVNSVNGKDEVLDRLLPVVKKYGAAVVGLTLDQSGIPETAEGRVEIAKKIITRCEHAGIPREHVIIDCLTMTVGADQRNAQITLEAVRQVHALGVKTALGVSNVSFGLPRRDLVNRTFFTLALQAGLNLSIINPADAGMMEALSVFRMLFGYDANGEDYIQRFAQTTAQPVAVPEKSAKGDVASAIHAGLEQQAKQSARSLLESTTPESLIADILIPTLDDVGKRYEKNEIFLPQLIRSAGAAKAAFDVVRERIAESKSEQANRGTIVLATVQGDIHDIGKNIVRAVLENYGYRIIDLGRDVPPTTVVEAVKSAQATLCGLSALMTTTLPAMEETIRLLGAQCPDCRVVVGGAVLTADYAAAIGAHYYAKDASATVSAAKIVFDT
ncbi:homocysteine S-methyltransferase family protein [Oscillospiraceae bacterium LTW-04]|nr:homocysteine S-methyltransferase family protein [Oscillospiraceae bacterium MB24-C1]